MNDTVVEMKTALIWKMKYNQRFQSVSTWIKEEESGAGAIQIEKTKWPIQKLLNPGTQYLDPWGDSSEIASHRTTIR